MIGIKKLSPGMTVYDVHREKMGNLRRATRLGCWEVLIESVDLENQCVTARWNVLNPPTKYWARNGKLPWRAEKPKEQKP